MLPEAELPEQVSAVLAVPESELPEQVPVLPAVQAEPETKPMSYFVTKELTQWSKNTEVIEYGEDARFANVKGLFIRAKVDEVKMEQAKAAGMASPMATQPQGQSVQPQVQPVQQVAHTLEVSLHILNQLFRQILLGNGYKVTYDVNTHKHIQRINYISAIVSCAVSKLKYGNFPSPAYPE